MFLFFEYGRPQDRFSLIGMLHPNYIFTLLMVISCFGSGRLSTASSPQTTRMLLMLFLLALHVPFAVNNYTAYTQTLDFFLFIPFFISVILFVDTFDKLQVFMRCWAWLAIYISLNGISRGGIGGSSFLADENDFALLMNVMLPICLMLFLYERKMLYLIASLLCVAGIVVSMSRGGFLGLVAVLGVIWLNSPHKAKSLLLVGTLALTVYFVANQTYWSEVSSITNTKESTAEQRLESWQAAWEMFKDHPFGVGGENFPILFPEYQPASMTRNMWGRQAHSLWFTLLPELGIPGVLLYLSLLRANVRDIWYLKKTSTDTELHRYVNFMSLAFAASLAGYFVSGSFLSVLYYPHYFYLTAIIVATRKLIDREGASSNEASMTS